MRTLDYIQDKQEQVLKHYGYEITYNRHIECVMCGKPDKMRINLLGENIRIICVCGSYSLIDFLMALTGKDFAAMAKEIDKDFGNDNHDYTPVKKDTTRRDKAIKLFKTAKPLRGSDGERYLNNRKIFNMPRGGIKFGEVYDKEHNRKIPAMIAIASNELGEPRMMHITYIEKGQKITWGTQRKMHSLHPKGLDVVGESIAIKLGRAGDLLGIAEGIETSLSANQIYQCPVWSVINTAYMKKFRAPPGVTKLYIFADNDSNGVGLAAAFECGSRNILANNDVELVRIRWPSKVNDFNDVLSGGDKVIEWQLSK